MRFLSFAWVVGAFHRRGKSWGERRDPGSLLQRDHDRCLALEVSRLRPDLLEPHKGVVPALLERRGHEAIRRVHLLVAALGQLGLVLGSFEAHAPLRGRRLVPVLKLQYDLAERARKLGWRADQVTVIDDDLGLSGATTQGRDGFARMTAQVALGRVGILLGLDVSRLARNNADWYQLLDLCGMTDTLIVNGRWKGRHSGQDGDHNM